MTPPPPVRFGLAGLGRMGRYHLERLSLRNDHRVVAVHDRLSTRRSELEGFDCRFHEDWRQFLRDDEIDAVLIATPPASHFPLALEVLQAGKPAIVEPPLCFTTAEADALLAAARNTNSPIASLSNRRWDDDFQTARAVLQSGELGPLQNILSISCEYGFPHAARPHGRTGWRADASQAGALIEFGTHQFDQLLQLVDTPPRRLFAQVSGGKPAQAPEDAFSASIEFTEGITAQLVVNLASPAPLQTGWMLAGTQGGYRKSRKHVLTDAGEIVNTPVDPLPTDWDRMYAEIARLLHDPTAQAQAATHARRAVALLQAARHSIETGQAIEIDA